MKKALKTKKLKERVLQSTEQLTLDIAERTKVCECAKIERQASTAEPNERKQKLTHKQTTEDNVKTCNEDAEAVAISQKENIQR